MKEEVMRFLDKFFYYGDKVFFLGHPPPKPINWEKVRLEILTTYDVIQQARAKVAREIFEEAEQRCIHYGSETNRWVKRCCDECWQSLKDKWLKEDE